MSKQVIKDFLEWLWCDPKDSKRVEDTIDKYIHWKESFEKLTEEEMSNMHSDGIQYYGICGAIGIECHQRSSSDSRCLNPADCIYKTSYVSMH